MNAEAKRLTALVDELLAQRNGTADQVIALTAALRSIEDICQESVSATRKRMGTKVGNILVIARAALATVAA